MAFVHESSPLRILYARNLYRPIDFGGNPYPLQVTSRLAARGHAVRVVTADFPGPALSPSVEVVRYPASRRTPLETFFTNAISGGLAVRRQVRAWSPDVVAISSYDVAYGYRRLGGADDVPVLFIYHSRFQSDAVDRVARRPWPLSLLHRPLRAFVHSVERTTYASASRIVAVSPFSRGEILGRSPAAADRTVVIPTGVDTDFFTPGDPFAARGRLGVPAEAFVMVAVGRIVPVKRYDRAIDAAALLRSRLARPLMLLVVGEGPELPSLRERAQMLGIADLVRFEGFREGKALRDRLRAGDVQLCTSDFENWSIALLEGLACGSPVLGTPRGGTPDLLRQVDPGLILPSTEPADLADALLALIASPQRLEALRRRAREVALAHSWERVVDRLEAECRSVASAERR